MLPSIKMCGGMQWLIVGVFIALSEAHPTLGVAPPEKCAAIMNSFCNHAPVQQKCVSIISHDKGELPLVALEDTGAQGGVPEWRCYSPTCLSTLSNGSLVYKKGSSCRLYCSRPELTQILENCTDPIPAPTGRQITVQPTDVFGKLSEECQMIRTPELTKSSSALLLFGQYVVAFPMRSLKCRHANASGGGARHTGSIGDDMRPVRMVLSVSTDHGSTWSPATFVTQELGTSVGVGIYDRIQDRILFQYQTFLNSNPYVGTTLYQSYSSDNGKTWSTAKNMSGFLAACNNGPGGQVCGAAGSRVQTESGRIVFSGHNAGGAGGGICVWYSDDGGETYNVSTSGLFVGNEQSIADLGGGVLYMNGRGNTFPWAGTRTSYWSHDNGVSWSAGVEARGLPEPDSFGCDGAVIAVPPTVVSHASFPPRVFFSEPVGPGGRVSLRVWCSYDGGHTWPRYTGINVGAVAAYSALEYYVENNATVLVVVWEQSPRILSYRLPVDDWCPEKAP